MSKRVIQFWAIIILFIAFGCNNDLDLVESGGDIPVVYAILKNTDTDTAQYFRIERGFIDTEQSALEIALNPDSLYYANASVSLTNTIDGSRFELTKVDGNEEGYPREDGIFLQSPNILYKMLNEDLQLQENASYRLTLDRGIEGLDLVTATTTIVEQPIIVRPNMSTPLSFTEVSPTLLQWRADDALDIFDVQIKFFYDELIGSTVESKVISYNVEQDLKETEIEVFATDFFSFIKSSIELNPNAIRVFRKIQVIVSSGSQELSDYIRVVQANQGITSSQEVPTYTNLSEGYGVFGSVSQSIRDNVGLVPNTLDSLRNGRFTSDLNFQ